MRVVSLFWTFLTILAVPTTASIAQEEDNTKEVVANVGIGGGDFFGGGSNSSNLAVVDIEFKDRQNRSHSTWDTIESIRKKLSKVTGGEFRVKEEEKGPLYWAP